MNAPLPKLLKLDKLWICDDCKVDRKCQFDSLYIQTASARLYCKVEEQEELRIKDS